MSDLTPAEELRTAAATLRTRAKAVEPDVAILHSAPWETESCDAGCQCIVSQTEPGSADIARVGRYIADAESPELADWIALMGPDMGPLLADWLEWMAKSCDSKVKAAGLVWDSTDAEQAAEAERFIAKGPSGLTAALATARKINAKEQP